MSGIFDVLSQSLQLVWSQRTGFSRWIQAILWLRFGSSAVQCIVDLCVSNHESSLENVLIDSFRTISQFRMAKGPFL